MKYTRTERINAATANEAAIFEVHPDAKSASISVWDDTGSWGTTVVTVEVSVDGRFGRTARTYLDRNVSTFSADGIAQRIDLRAAKFIRARVSTVGSSGTYLRVQCTQTEGKPSDRYVDVISLALTVNGGTSPGDTTPFYWGLPGAGATTSTDIRRYYPGAAGTIVGAVLNSSTLAGVVGSNESWEMLVRLNATTDYSVATTAASTQFRQWINYNMAVPIASATDYVEVKSIPPAWATNPTTVVYWGALLFVPRL
jgi:hypothetical protein